MQVGGGRIIVDDSGEVMATLLLLSMQVGAVIIGHWSCWSS